MTTEPAAASSPAIAQDVPCITCGYNLRGLNPGGACPECATAIAVSLSEQAAGISTTSVIWARCMVVGLLGWMMITAFGILLHSYVYVSAHDRYPGPQLWGGRLESSFSQGDDARIDPVAFSGPMWAAACLVMIYLITSPRTPPVLEVTFSLRRIARWFSIIAGGFMVAQTRAHADWGLPRDTMFFVAIVATILLYLYLARVARDIGLRSEGQALRVAAIVAGIIMGLSMVWAYWYVAVTDPFFGPREHPWIQMPIGRQVDSILSTIGTIAAVIVAATMIRIALAILPMTRQRRSAEREQVLP